MCFFLLPCIPSRAIDCTTIKGKLTATRKPYQATALGGELPLSLESSKSLISDVFLLYSVESVRSFRSFLFVYYLKSDSGQVNGCKQIRMNGLFSYTGGAVRTYCEQVLCLYSFAILCLIRIQLYTRLVGRRAFLVPRLFSHTPHATHTYIHTCTV